MSNPWLTQRLATSKDSDIIALSPRGNTNCNVGKNNHHYVPRFYLNGFASEPKRINIYHLGNDLRIRSGSLKGQCYRHKFYGKHDDIENALMDLEGSFAPVIKRIRTGEWVKLSLSDVEIHQLQLFAAVQATRTQAAAQKVAEGLDSLFKAVYSRYLESQDIDPSTVRASVENPVIWAMENAGRVAISYADLQLHLIINETSIDFITSDNPVVQYNQYCEKVCHLGGIGSRSLGLQLFLPISPTRLLMFYDPSIYRLKDRNGITRVSNVDDIRALNCLSSVNADRVILFSNWNNCDEHAKTAQTASRFRVEKKASIEEYQSQSEESKSLIRFFFPSVNVGLNLSFVGIRRRARTLPLGDRIMQFRDRPIRRPKPGVGGHAFLKRS